MDALFAPAGSLSCRSCDCGSHSINARPVGIVTRATQTSPEKSAFCIEQNAGPDRFDPLPISCSFAASSHPLRQHPYADPRSASDMQRGRRGGHTGSRDVEVDPGCVANEAA